MIPLPVEMTPRRGDDFRVSPRTVIRVEPGAEQVGAYLAGLLRLPVVASGRHGSEIALLLHGAGERVGAAGYRLDTGHQGVTIRANTPAGLFAGVQTLRQLLPAEPREGWVVPGGEIVDYPRFAYRGAMLDLARHFHTPGEVKRFIDQIAQYKFNYLHLHLTDDQGWRIQIDSWPELTARGGGPGTGVDGAGPGYLTKAEYADLTAYAAARHITVVPEVDMPGHTNAALATFAELNCDGVAVPPRTDATVGYSSLCIGSEITYRFLADVIGELAAMTPGPFLHIGGDEAHATSAEDYRTFLARVFPLVAAHGKRVIGWHEIATAEPPADAVMQFWGTTPDSPTVAAAAARGAKVIMSPSNRAYLDMKYDPQTPLGLDWAGHIEVRDAYDWDPATAVAGVGEGQVLGVEAPLWSETLRTGEHIDFLAFPRLPAIAELGWSARGSQDWESFRARLAGHAERWERQGIDYYRSPQVWHAG